MSEFPFMCSDCGQPFAYNAVGFCAVCNGRIIEATTDLALNAIEKSTWRGEPDDRMYAALVSELRAMKARLWKYENAPAPAKPATVATPEQLELVRLTGVAATIEGAAAMEAVLAELFAWRAMGADVETGHVTWIMEDEALPPRDDEKEGLSIEVEIKSSRYEKTWMGRYYYAFAEWTYECGGETYSERGPDAKWRRLPKEQR